MLMKVEGASPNLRGITNYHNYILGERQQQLADASEDVARVINVTAINIDV